MLDKSVQSFEVVRVERMTPECCDLKTHELRIARDTNEIKVPPLNRWYDHDDTEVFIFVNDAVIGIPKLWDMFIATMSAKVS